MQRTIIRLGILLALVCAPAIAHAGVGGALGGGFVPPTKMGNGTANAGDITDVVAGVGLTGGAATGAATLTVDTTYVQRRVSGTCLSSQKLLSINADGSANCAADNDTTYTAGSGITSLGNVIAIDPTYTQRRVSGTCATGNAIRIIDQTGTVTCEPGGTGTVTNVATGTGLTGGPITGTGTISVSLTPTTCTAGSHIFSIAAGGTGTCTADAAGGGTVSNVATTFPVAGGPITSTGTLSLSLCTANQVLKMNAGATAYACAADVDTNSGGTVTNVATGVGLSGGPITGTGTIALANTTVTLGSYTYPTITVDAQGRLTAAASGAAPTTYTGTAPISVVGSAISLANTTVTPAAYTNTSLTVDAQGRITTASSGAAPVTGSGTANMLPKFGTTTSLADSPVFSNTATMLEVASGTILDWSSTAVASGVVDVGLGRNFAGTLEVNNGVLGTYRDMLFRTLYLTGNHLMASTGLAGWSSTASPTGAVDAAIGRNGVGILEVNTGTAGTFASLKALNGTFSGTVSAFLNAELASTSLVRWASTTTPGTTPDLGLSRRGISTLEINTGVAGTLGAAGIYTNAATFTGKTTVGVGGIVDGSAAPGLGTCPTGTTIAGGQTHFKLVLGTASAPQSCVVNFPTASGAFVCTATFSGTKAGYPIITAASTTSITIAGSTGTTFDGITVYVHCGS